MHAKVMRLNTDSPPWSKDKKIEYTAEISDISPETGLDPSCTAENGEIRGSPVTEPCRIVCERCAKSGS